VAKRAWQDPEFFMPGILRCDRAGAGTDFGLAVHGRRIAITGRQNIRIKLSHSPRAASSAL
jgi:hypothetical protein